MELLKKISGVFALTNSIARGGGENLQPQVVNMPQIFNVELSIQKCL